MFNQSLGGFRDTTGQEKCKNPGAGRKSLTREEKAGRVRGQGEEEVKRDAKCEERRRTRRGGRRWGWRRGGKEEHADERL